MNKYIHEINVRLDQLDISRYQLAKETGLSESTIKRMLEGINDPLLGNLLKCYWALGMDLKITKKRIGQKQKGLLGK